MSARTSSMDFKSSPSVSSGSFSAANSDRKRPLTVDEMIALKKQEIQRKREMEGRK